MNNTRLGILFTLMSAFFYALQTALVKQAAPATPIQVLVFVQSLVCLLLMLPILFKRYRFDFLNPVTFSQVKKLHLVRVIASMGISYFLFLALKKQPYFDSMILYNVSPILVPILGRLVLKQSVRASTWFYIALGFFGVALVLHPDRAIFSLASTLGLGSAVSAALSMVMIRKISFVDESLKSVYYYFLLSTIIAALVMVLTVHHWAISMSNLALLCAIGVLFFGVQYCLNLAATRTNVVIVSTLYYSNIIFSLLVSRVIFHESLSLQIISGMLLIVAGGLGVIWMQTKKPSIAGVLQQSLS